MIYRPIVLIFWWSTDNSWHNTEHGLIHSFFILSPKCADRTHMWQCAWWYAFQNSQARMVTALLGAGKRTFRQDEEEGGSTCSEQLRASTQSWWRGGTGSSRKLLSQNQGLLSVADTRCSFHLLKHQDNYSSSHRGHPLIQIIQSLQISLKMWNLVNDSCLSYQYSQ